MTKRWWLPNRGANASAIKRGLTWLDEVTEAGDRAGLVVRTKSCLHDSMLGELVGDEWVRLLTTSHRVRMHRAGWLSLLAVHGNRHRLSFQGSLLLVHPEKKELDFADAIADVERILVIPWERADVAFWIDQWAVAELGNAPASASPPRLGVVVQRGLQTLFGLVPTDIRLRPKDRGFVVGLFSLLLQHGERFSADEVRAWIATRPDGDPRFADDVAAIARDVLEGRRLRDARQFGTAESIERWRQPET